MSIVEQTTRRLQELIREHKLQPGERLPAERALAEQLQVSRSSLREAIQKLSGVGMLQSRRGGGTYLQSLQPVLNPDQWTEQSLVAPLARLCRLDPEYRYDVLEARHALESSTAWHAAHRATEEDKQRLQACHAELLRAQEAGNPDLASQADAHFHLAIAEASHNLVLLQTMRGLFDLLQSTVTENRQKMYSVPQTLSRLADQHREVLDAILAGDAERARDAVGKHLEFVHSTVRMLDEDEARRERSARLPSWKPLQ